MQSYAVIRNIAYEIIPVKPYSLKIFNKNFRTNFEREDQHLLRGIAGGGGVQLEKLHLYRQATQLIAPGGTTGQKRPARETAQPTYCSISSATTDIFGTTSVIPSAVILALKNGWGQTVCGCSKVL